MLYHEQVCTSRLVSIHRSESAGLTSIRILQEQVHTLIPSSLFGDVRAKELDFAASPSLCFCCLDAASIVRSGEEVANDEYRYVELASILILNATLPMWERYRYCIVEGVVCVGSSASPTT